MPQVAAMGAAVSIVDVDRDGWQDIHVTNSGEGSHNRLYRNLGDGTFQEVAAAMGVADVNQPATGVSMGAVWGDYDNDGYDDLWLYKWGRPELFRNEQRHRFERVTVHAGLPRWINASRDVMEWLRRVLPHVLPAGVMPVRHGGLLPASCAMPLPTIRRLSVPGHPRADRLSHRLHPQPCAARCPTCGIPLRVVLR